MRRHRLSVTVRPPWVASRQVTPAEVARARADSPLVVPLTPPLVNTYLVKGDRAVLVDTGYPGSDERLLTRLRDLGVAPGDVALILLTHGHRDHFGGARALREATGAPVAVHEADAEPVRSGVSPPVTPVADLRLLGRLVQRRVLALGLPPVPGLKPQVLLRGGETLEAYGVNARVVWTPGHTAGSVSLRVGPEALVGDLLSGNPLLPNRPDPPYFAEDLGALHASLEVLLGEGARTLHVGHGRAVSAGSVRRRFGGA